MFGVLDRYIGRTIFNTSMVVLFLLVSLSGVIKFVEQLRSVGKGDYSVIGAGLFTLLTVPEDIELFFPMAALLGALLGLGALATRSELVVMQAAGFTKLRVAGAVLKMAIPLVLLSMAIGEWLAPLGEQTARNMRVQMISGGTILSNQTGLWAKDGDDFIYIERVKGDAKQAELIGLSIYHFDQQRQLKSIRYAASAEYDANKKQWELFQVEESDVSEGTQITGSQTITAQWQTNLTPDKLGVVAIKADALSISGLYKYIAYLKTTGQEAKSYQFSFWKKVLAPLSMVVMLLLALSFMFGPLRSVAMGVRIVTGVTFGFLFFLLNEVFGKLSLVINVPAIVIAALPSMLFITIAVYLLRKRD